MSVRNASVLLGAIGYQNFADNLMASCAAVKAPAMAMAMAMAMDLCESATSKQRVTGRAKVSMMQLYVYVKILCTERYYEPYTIRR